MKKARHSTLSWWKLTVFFLILPYLLLPCQSAFGYGGGKGASDKVNSGINSRGPQVGPIIGIEGMPVMPPEEWGNPWLKCDKPKPVNKRTPTFEEKVATTVIEYAANKAQDHIQDFVLDFVFASNPEVVVAIKTIQGIHQGVVLTAATLRRIQKEKKAYEKAIMGARNSNQVQTTQDGVAAGPGHMNPNFPGCGYGMPGPQQDMGSNQLW